MSGMDDSGAAGRVQAFVDVWLVPGRDAIERIHADRSYELRASDLRAVLAEHEAMRKQMAAMTAEWAASHPRNGHANGCRLREAHLLAEAASTYADWHLLAAFLREHANAAALVGDARSTAGDAAAGNASPSISGSEQ